MSEKNTEGNHQFSSINQGKLSNRFSCFLIGSESHLIQCAEILLQRGNSIFGVISSEASIESWARDRGIPYLEPTPDLTSVLNKRPFVIYSVLPISPSFPTRF
jgi:hypothetical protein